MALVQDHIEELDILKCLDVPPNLLIACNQDIVLSYLLNDLGLVRARAFVNNRGELGKELLDLHVPVVGDCGRADDQVDGLDLGGLVEDVTLVEDHAKTL